MIESYDAVVVGSGFGGSISSLRLAQAGKSTVVLERGKRYKPGDFPRDVTNVNESSGAIRESGRRKAYTTSAFYRAWRRSRRAVWEAAL